MRTPPQLSPRGIGSRIAAARRRSNLTLEELGRKLGGLTRQQVSHWERGVRSPGSRYLQRLARALGCSTDYLLGLSND